MFNEKMGITVFVVEANNGIASSLISHKIVAILKEYKLRRQYDSKHLLKYRNCPTWCISCFFGFSFLICVIEAFLLKSFVLSSLLTYCLWNFYIFSAGQLYKFKRTFRWESFARFSLKKKKIFF